MSNGWVPLSLGRVEPGPDPAARMCYPREKRGGLRLMQDVTELINNHRECSRHLWNVYFGSQENTSHLPWSRLHTGRLFATSRPMGLALPADGVTPARTRPPSGPM